MRGRTFKLEKKVRAKTPKQELACHVPQTARRPPSSKYHEQGDEVREAMETQITEGLVGNL